VAPFLAQARPLIAIQNVRGWWLSETIPSSNARQGGVLDEGTSLETALVR
jgi:hypothetical protein